ncbi:SANT/Myb_domain [Hexamita inflata]|uniref:SANT/Myb domain n=1 Tax=Hexamita inflata TaxID=28002 RepID=A0AA86U762_9EUKA|nr:SANT/Myb domain [Hexamita inflata]
MKTGQVWTEEENIVFKDLIQKYHKDFRQVASEMNRTYTQVRSHYYNIQSKNSTPESNNKKMFKDSQNNSQQTQNSSQYIVFDGFE